MATVKLTKDIRRAICSRVLKHRFLPVVEELIQDQASYADRVYKDVYPKVTLGKMKALPSGWLGSNGSISVRFGEDNSHFARLEYNGMTDLLGHHLHGLVKDRDAVKKLQLAKYKGVVAKIYPVQHTFSIQWESLKFRREMLEDEYTTAIRSVNVALSKVHTIRALIKEWPEVEPFVQSFEPTQLPVVPRETLNELLDLPVGDVT